VDEPVLIVNPSASGVGEERLRKVAAALGARHIRRTEGPGHAVELARAASREGLPIVVFAGDGGFNEALNGLEGDVPIGFVPGGGTNVLPRALGLPRDPVAAARRLASGRTRRISLGRVNGRRFAFAAGLGLDAELIRRMEALGRTHGRRERDVRVAWIALRLLAERRAHLPPALEIDGYGRAAFALVANGDPYTFVGRFGMHVAPEARFELGLDVVAPRALRARAVPRFVWYAFTGRGQARAEDVLYGHDLDRLTIRAETPVPLQVDGEDLGDVTEAAFEAERDAVTVLV
jgi:diacylglycerol kinase family enzyme